MKKDRKEIKKKQFYSFLVFLVVLILALGVFYYFSLNKVNEIKKSPGSDGVGLSPSTSIYYGLSDISKLNNDLYNLAKQKSNSLTAKAQERKQKMLELADKNPALFLTYSIPKNQIENEN